MPLEFDTNKILGTPTGDYVISQQSGLIRKFLVSWGVDADLNDKTLFSFRFVDAKRFSIEEATRSIHILQRRGIKDLVLFEVTPLGHLRLLAPK